MPQPPRSRDRRPPRPEPLREASVYRHPDAAKTAPPEVPVRKRPQAAPAPYGSFSAGRGTSPRRAAAPGSPPPSRPARAGNGPDARRAPWRGESSGTGTRPPRDQGRERSRGPSADSATGRDSRVRAGAALDEPAAPDPRREQRRREVRIHGRAACLAVAEDRFGAIRKLWCSLRRSKELAPLLSRLAQARVGYTVVEDAELERLAESQHHEGIVLDVERLPQPALARLLGELEKQSGPACLVALDGVGNPHNFGAILRSAVHFGARAVLVPSGTSLTLSGAAYRVAEGAAERVPVVRYDDLQQLKGHGFALLASAGSGEHRLYREPLPTRCIVLFGAEGPGLARPALEAADARIAIPGSGRVDSLNVAQAVAVVLGEWWRGARG